MPAVRQGDHRFAAVGRQESGHHGRADVERYPAHVDVAEQEIDPFLDDKILAHQIGAVAGGVNDLELGVLRLEFLRQLPARNAVRHDHVRQE